MTTQQKIDTWNNLPKREKMAMGDHYITHESDLNAWNKPFDQLSELKKERVLQSIEEFSKVKDHKLI